MIFFSQTFVLLYSRSSQNAFLINKIWKLYIYLFSGAVFTDLLLTLVPTQKKAFMPRVTWKKENGTTQAHYIVRRYWDMVSGVMVKRKRKFARLIFVLNWIFHKQTKSVQCYILQNFVRNRWEKQSFLKEKNIA